MRYPVVAVAIRLAVSVYLRFFMLCDPGVSGLFSFSRELETAVVSQRALDTTICGTGPYTYVWRFFCRTGQQQALEGVKTNHFCDICTDIVRTGNGGRYEVAPLPCRHACREQRYCASKQRETAAAARTLRTIAAAEGGPTPS